MLEVEMNAYADQIRREFPDFHFSSVQYAGKGEDHIVVLIDGTWIFRFRKLERLPTSIGREVAVTEALRERGIKFVPRYEYVSADKMFGGYRVIEGDELTVDRFIKIPTARRADIVSQFADFLNALHGLPHRTVEEQNERYWDPRDITTYLRRYKEARREVLGTATSSHLLEKIDTFYSLFSEIQPPAYKVVHADLYDDHILVDESDRISGIIDFADASLADPARDFSFFWSYGEDIAEGIYEQYVFHDDSALLRRSQWHHVRHYIDRLYYELREGEQGDFLHDKSILETALERLF